MYEESVDGELLDETYSAHFDFTSEMMNKLYECRGINITNEETFAFDFLVCLLQANTVDYFWKLYDFHSEQGSVIPADHDLNSSCMTFGNLSKYDSSSCIPPHGLLPLNESGSFLTLTPIDITLFKTSSFSACLERNGSLPYAETKQEF